MCMLSVNITDEENETQGGKDTCPSSNRWSETSPELDPKQSL